MKTYPCVGTLSGDRAVAKRCCAVIQKMSVRIAGLPVSQIPHGQLSMFTLVGADFIKSLQLFW